MTTFKLTVSIFWSILPLYMIGSFSAIDSQVVDYTPTISILSPDSIAPVIDTIIIFDPVTKTETIKTVESEDGEYNMSIVDKDAEKGRVDTVIIFDIETKEEKIFIVKHD